MFNSLGEDLTQYNFYYIFWSICLFFNSFKKEQKQHWTPLTFIVLTNELGELSLFS